MQNNAASQWICASTRGAPRKVVSRRFLPVICAVTIIVLWPGNPKPALESRHGDVDTVASPLLLFAQNVGRKTKGYIPRQAKKGSFAQDAAPQARSAPDVFDGLSVGEVVIPGDFGCVLSADDELGYAAAELAAAGKSAAAVTKQGSLIGLLTEIDILRAYYEGISANTVLGDWLSSGMRRAVDLDMVTVRPSDSLTEVAKIMVLNAVRGNGPAHHVIVQGRKHNDVVAVVSSRDFVEATFGFNNPRRGDITERRHDVQMLEGLMVQDAMKRREDVFTCSPHATLEEALEILLVTQQNSLLVVEDGDEGILGIITPRDLATAFSEQVPYSAEVFAWMEGARAGFKERVIDADAQLSLAANRMSLLGVDHLVVVSPDSNAVVGTISSLDLIFHASRRVGLLPAEVLTPKWEGPTVGELVTAQDHLSAVCDPDATLGDAAELMIGLGRTSAAVVTNRAGGKNKLKLITETDIMQAYVDGQSRDSSAESWLLSQGRIPSALPKYSQVRPSARLTEAATLLLEGPTHHLAVLSSTGSRHEWFGVFSALDVARGLLSLGNKLDAAKMNINDMDVAMVMKPLSLVPRCTPQEKLQDALAALLRATQQAAFVFDEHGAYYGIITPRCALHAMAEGFPKDATVLSWLRREKAVDMSRQVEPETGLLQAAKLMVDADLHHLVVKESGASLIERPVGVVSSLDIARSLTSLHSHIPFESLGWLNLWGRERSGGIAVGDESSSQF
eukprot:TRINITY_DN59714_c0_g1_i1.p1 TRINITY_DN59714_c0_g1~~TRINITY_DN59714_c0_g1_i1.p1  ORF type:complete len:767 (+),score=140.45 TRINITY_DN59714_c0_g1_i1:100-2301(+)